MDCVTCTFCNFNYVNIADINTHNMASAWTSNVTSIHEGLINICSVKIEVFWSCLRTIYIIYTEDRYRVTCSFWF